MILLTCKNHTNLRWMRKPPEDIGRSLFFLGEVTEAGHRKEQGLNSLPPVYTLRHRLNGRNPFAPERDDLAEKGITTWDEVLKFVEWVEWNAKRYATECECPPSDLEIMRGEDGGYVDASTWHDLTEVPQEVTE